MLGEGKELDKERICLQERFHTAPPACQTTFQGESGRADTLIVTTDVYIPGRLFKL
ncbi:mCG146998 [Mus musculus]|jgi:hypothetical protein|nr:mCG146998 [Mus musculus]